MNILRKAFLLLIMSILFIVVQSCAKAEPILDSTQHEFDQSTKIEKILKSYSKNLKDQKLVSLVDYSKPIGEPRFFVYNIRTKKIIYSTFVGHSGYSGIDKPIYTSNQPNTRKTSLGLFKVGKQYYGRFGKSKRLHGLSNSNSNALKRAIVAHSMPGNSPKDLYSWGCFTFFEKDLDAAFKFLKNGTYLIAVN